jgi:adenylylsulfate kinase-like enzyme
VDGAAVRRELKRELKQKRDGRLKPPRLIATSCFGICPKRAIVLTSVQSLNKGQYVLVSDRAQLDEALDLLRSSNTKHEPEKWTPVSRKDAQTRS